MILTEFLFYAGVVVAGFSTVCAVVGFIKDWIRR